MRLKLLFGLALFVRSIKNEHVEKRPNIVFIMADDLGWDDLSYHGSNQIMTPNIDTLAYEGIILSQYYTDVQGTPSRSALFTGKYPIKIGAQGISIAAAEDRGVPISERLLPSHLQDMGYVTHLIGKWSLGKSRKHYLPTNRGFNTFYGFLGSSVDYYTYNRVENWNDSSFYGLDFFNNLVPVEDQKGHLTDLLTARAVELIRHHDTKVPLYLHISHAAPHNGGGFVNLQTQEENIATNDHIAHTARRLYAGLVTGVDKSVGKIVEALAERDILRNTIIIFVSDNGADSTGSSRNFGCNLPLRGTKGSPWEGGVRSPAIIWKASLPSKIWNGLFHVTDWLPTIIAAAGGKFNETIDGFDQWNAISDDAKSPRTDILLAMDDLENWAAFREEDFKIIIGDVDVKSSGYYGMNLKPFRLPVFSYESVLSNSETAIILRETLDSDLDIEYAMMKRNYSNVVLHMDRFKTENRCVPSRTKGCLFNISADPTELNDLWDTFPEVVKHMALRLRVYWAQLSPRREPKLDQRANPALHNYIWLPWLDNDEKSSEALQTPPSFPLRVSAGELQYLVNLNVNTFKDSFMKYMNGVADALVKSVGELFSF